MESCTSFDRFMLEKGALTELKHILADPVAFFADVRDGE